MTYLVMPAWTATRRGGKVDLIQYLTPSLGVYGLAVGCFAVPIFGLANARQQGLLKRVRGTPLSPWVYVASWVAGSALTGLASLALMFVVGIPAFGVHIRPSCRRRSSRRWSAPPA